MEIKRSMQRQIAGELTSADLRDVVDECEERRQREAWREESDIAVLDCHLIEVIECTLLAKPTSLQLARERERERERER